MECEWTRKICTEMENAGAVIRVLYSTKESSGLPDRLVVAKQFCGLLEFKAETTPLQLNQGMLLRSIKTRNENFAFVVRKPNLIQSVIPDDCRCVETVAMFDGTGRHLLDMLALLTH